MQRLSLPPPPFPPVPGLTPRVVGVTGDDVSPQPFWPCPKAVGSDPTAFGRRGERHGPAGGAEASLAGGCQARREPVAAAASPRPTKTPPETSRSTRANRGLARSQADAVPDAIAQAPSLMIASAMN